VLGLGSAQVAFAVASNHMDKDFGKISQCVSLASGSTYYMGTGTSRLQTRRCCELWYYTPARAARARPSIPLSPSNISVDVNDVDVAVHPGLDAHRYGQRASHLPHARVGLGAFDTDLHKLRRQRLLNR
jgi:hypothetical protein